jgi:hypothetical protein
MHEYARAFTWNPNVNVVCGNLGKQESSFVGPHWTFGPFVETSGDALEPGVRADYLIERGIELLDILSKRRNSWDQERKKDAVHRDHRAAKSTARCKCIHVSLLCSLFRYLLESAQAALAGVTNPPLEERRQ